VRELSLFSGAGGGLLATHHLLGWKTCGYVEFNDYCQRVIAARIRDGLLTDAPIFGDIRTFVSEGYAASYTGLVDVVSAGFPCQPFSVAGKQAGADDERNMWPATRDVIRIVRPRSVLLENVPGLLGTGYVWTIFADLAALGFVGRWGVLGAAEFGAPHLRERLWIVAHDNSRRGAGHIQGGSVVEARPWGASSAQAVQSANPKRPGEGWPQPLLCGVDARLAHTVDRLKAIGNGQCSQVAASAWEVLA
jgi:DNA (cytosine-5)-methyltransferase 1